VNGIPYYESSDDEGDYDGGYAPRLSRARRYVPDVWDEVTDTEACAWRAFCIDR
jgi:hypothetical protein